VSVPESRAVTPYAELKSEGLGYQGASVYPEARPSHGASKNAQGQHTVLEILSLHQTAGHGMCLRSIAEKILRRGRIPFANIRELASEASPRVETIAISFPTVVGGITVPLIVPLFTYRDSQDPLTRVLISATIRAQP
jgi:hypothetical protein